MCLILGHRKRQLGKMTRLFKEIMSKIASNQFKQSFIHFIQKINHMTDLYGEKYSPYKIVKTIFICLKDNMT